MSNSKTPAQSMMPSRRMAKISTAETLRSISLQVEEAVVVATVEAVEVLAVEEAAAVAAEAVAEIVGNKA